MSIAADIQSLSPGAIIDLFELDATNIDGNTIVRWCNYVNEKGTDVIWDGNTYTRIPVKADGFEKSSDGKQPRPKLTVSNVGGIVGNFTRGLDDLVGAKVTRIRTFVKYLDADNFVSGNPQADPNVAFPIEVWGIDRKASENPIQIVFELASSLDLSGVKLPNRQVTQNSCWWQYRSGECGYTGPAVATRNDEPTNIDELDDCGKRIESCKLRFGENNELPIGCFPGVGK